MQVHKITLYIVDHDNVGLESAAQMIEDASYPNRCLNPHVISAESREIGPWHDDHPLNSHAEAKAELERLFNT